jgi:enoyl-CoA hydratase/carnithine racemase
VSAPAPTEPRLLYAVSDGVATVTLNRPARLNAIDHGPGSLQRELVETLERADADPDVRCMIVTGAGRAFSSGGELGAAADLLSSTDWYWFLHQEDVDNERIRHLRKPVIGAINGLCFGAGLIMAVHFDFLVASDRARFGLIETRYGGTGVDVLAYHVGFQWAKFLSTTGELIDAPTAQQIGLVVAVVPDAAFAEKVSDLARRVASMPEVAVASNRRVVNGAMEHMGWTAQKEHALALNAVANGVGREARAADGRRFSDLLSEGWEVFKEARDAPFRPPWLSS